MKAKIERDLAELRRQEPCQLEVRYDRFKDETLDGCMYAIRSNLYAPADEISLHLMAQYTGKEPSGKIRFYFALDRFYLNASQAATFSFGDVSDLLLIVDDVRVSLPITDYKPKRVLGLVMEGVRSPDDVFENAVANIDTNTLLALSSAHSVEARWGPKELSLSPTAIERMQQFIRRYTNKTTSK